MSSVGRPLGQRELEKYEQVRARKKRRSAGMRGRAGKEQSDGWEERARRVGRMCMGNRDGKSVGQLSAQSLNLLFS